jgi:hypothetical protein
MWCSRKKMAQVLQRADARLTIASGIALATSSTMTVRIVDDRSSTKSMARRVFDGHCESTIAPNRCNN